MRIGVDFDNTIANYDGVFHAAALDLGLIPAELETTKNAVRDHLNHSGRKDAFTELQGYIYGARMDLVSPYPGVAEFVADACERGHSVFVISHKTRKPLMGPAYDMHEAARGFLEAHGFFAAGLLGRDQTFFEITKEEKVARAGALEVDVFIDDLPEILAMEGFPPSCRRILFDPAGYSGTESSAFERLSSWRDIHAALLDGS